MTKKVKPEDMPVTTDTVVRILQSRCAHRGRYIGSAELKLSEQKGIIASMRVMQGMPFTADQKALIYGKVINPIRADIAELAYEQKLERTVLKALAQRESRANYLDGLIDEVIGVVVKA